MGINLSAGGVSRTVALGAIQELAERWGVPKTKRYLLLGQPESTVNHWFAALNRDELGDAPLDQTMLERISHLVSIYDGLHRLFVGGEADAWMHRANRAFAERTPLDVLLTGSFENLLKVRYYIDQALYR
jgi:hypothetical protein